jgi:hypothetical protein
MSEAVGTQKRLVQSLNLAISLDEWQCGARYSIREERRVCTTWTLGEDLWFWRKVLATAAELGQHVRASAPR